MILTDNHTAEEEKITHPSHYVQGRKYEPKDVIRDWGLVFNLGNVIKYVARAGRKKGSSTLEDLKKARQYLDFEIDYQSKQEEYDSCRNCTRNKN